MPSIGQWLTTVDKLYRLEAELLLEHHTGLTRPQQLARPETLINDSILSKLGRDLARIEDHEPLAYILGTREFWGLPFTIAPQVLVPRPETELLVELVLEAAHPQQTVLDLGTGSGAIAIAIAHERPDLIVTAADQSRQALRIAAMNARDLNTHITLLHSNWYSGLSERYDIIVSNPPYIHPDDPHLAQLHLSLIHI